VVPNTFGVRGGLINHELYYSWVFEAFAMANKPLPSVLSAIGNAQLRFWILIIVAVI